MNGYMIKMVRLSELQTLGDEGQYLAVRFHRLIIDNVDPLIPFVGKPGGNDDFAVYAGHPEYDNFKMEVRYEMEQYQLNSPDRVVRAGDKVCEELGCALFPELAKTLKYRR